MRKNLYKNVLQSMLDFWENDEKGLKCFFSLQICQDFIKSFYKVGVKKIKSGEIR